MADQQQKYRRHVTLEQLLKLKRSERPDAHFWEDFDRELHRRQLASIVTRPAWHVRLGRSMIVGLRRTAPLGAAAVAAVAGFMVLQRTPETDAVVAPNAVAEPMVTPVQVADLAPSAAVALVVDRPEMPEPAFERLAASEPRFVVHEFVALASPTRSFVSVTSPNTFSSAAYDPSVQMVNILTSGYGRRAATSTEAGRF